MLLSTTALSRFCAPYQYGIYGRADRGVLRIYTIDDGTLRFCRYTGALGWFDPLTMERMCT